MSNIENAESLYMASLQKTDPKQAHVISQYQRAVGSLNEMFASLSPRTRGESWRIDGVGACRMPKDMTEGWFRESIIDNVIQLRELRSKADAGEVADGPVCPYHRKGRGCCLGDLKSPFCVSFIDNPEELNFRFGIDGEELVDAFEDGLIRIQLGPDQDPEHEDYVDEFVIGVDLLKKHILKFPEVEKTFGLMDIEGEVLEGALVEEFALEEIQKRAAEDFDY